MLEANAIQVRIGELCHQFRLPTMGAQSVSRFTAAGHGDALETLLEVLEQEAEDRRQRRIGRLRTASRLPAGKTWETFEHDRVPLALRQQLGELSDGSFVDRGVNVLAFGLPGTGKTHALCALGHRLVEAGRSVLFAPAYRLVQDLLAAKRDLALPRQLRKLDNYDFLLLDDLGYLPQGPKSPRCSSRSSPNATNAGPWASRPTWSSLSGSTSSPTRWPRLRPSTGWSTTRSSWNSTSPATAPEWPSSAVRNRG